MIERSFSRSPRFGVGPAGIAKLETSTRGPLAGSRGYFSADRLLGTVRTEIPDRSIHVRDASIHVRDASIHVRDQSIHVHDRSTHVR